MSLIDKSNKVFLGGTCAGSSWRETIEKFLRVPFFNPVVDDWKPENIAIEDDEKVNRCNIHLYHITNAMKGVYSIAEAVESAANKNKVTVFCLDVRGFDDGQLRSLRAVTGLLKRHGAVTLESSNMAELADILNALK